MRHKLTAILTACAMLCTMVPVAAAECMTAIAEEAIEFPNSGICGENVTWTLSDDGTLTISGTGEMEYYCALDVGIPLGGPWDPEGNRGVVRKVVIEEGVTSVGGGAFANHTNLTSVTLPESLTSIDFRAFNHCPSLRSITIPKNVSKISSAFESCEGLEEINVASGNTHYHSKDGVLFETESAMLVQYPGGKKDATYAVPEGTKIIRDKAFDNPAALISVRIPASVEEFRYGYLANCLHLISYEVDEENPSYQSIEGVLFSKDGTNLLQMPCGRTGRYVVPDGVTEICYYAFYESSLTEVRIPEGITELGTFYDCPNLETVTLPASLKTIYDGSSFAQCPNLQTVHFSEGIESIYAFSDCPSLTSISFPASLKKLEGFRNCTGLKEVEFQEGLTEINAFNGCTALQSVTFPESLETLSGFQGCTSLSTVTLPNGLKKLNAFNDCTGLRGDITIPLSVEEIYSFMGCTSLNRLIFLDADSSFSSWMGGRMFSSFAYEKSPVIIRAYQESGILRMAKEEGLSFEEITKDGRIVSGKVGDDIIWTYEDDGTVTLSGTGGIWDYGEAYGMTPPWEEAGIKDEIKTVTVEAGITALDSGLFYGCPNLTEVTIPGSVTDLNIGFFGETPFLSDITGVKYLNGWVLDCGDDVTELVIEEGTKGIADNAFWEKGFTSVTIPESVTYIGHSAFYSCDKLSRVTLPEKLAYLGAGAFADCKNLRDLDSPEDIEFVGGGTFSGTPLQTNNKILYVGGWAANSAPTIETAKIAPGTKAISDCTFNGREELTTVEIPDSVTYIGNEAFAYSGITSIIIPDSVTDCGGSLFNFCRNLKTAVLSDNITELKVTELAYSDDTCFFGNCHALEEVHLPKHLKVLDGLYCCMSLKTLEIPEEVERIEKIRQCTALTEITIPENVQFIGKDAIAACSELKKITVLNPSLSFEGTISFDGTFYGYEGSSTQYYAQEHGLEFVSLDAAPSETALGDINTDSIVNASDAAQILIAAAAIGAGGDPNLTETQKTAADVNGDGSINASDAAVVLIYAAAVGAGQENVKIEDFVHR